MTKTTYRALEVKTLLLDRANLAQRPQLVVQHVVALAQNAQRSILRARTPTRTCQSYHYSTSP